MKLLFFSSIKGPDLYLPLNLLTLATHAQALGHEVPVVDGQTEDDWPSVCTELALLHERTPAAISSKDLSRLTDSAEPEHDYVERFML